MAQKTWQEELEFAYQSFAVSVMYAGHTPGEIKKRADRLRAAISVAVPQDECTCECGGNQHIFEDGSKCPCICHD